MEAALDSTLVQACATAEKLEESKKECQRLRTQNLELQKDLRDAQDFIFSLQRREQSITESEAGAEFNSLCMVVENWVQTKLGEALEKSKARMKPKLPAERIRTLLSFIPQPGKEAFHHPDTDEYNIIAMIIRFLCLEIFETDFYCPVEKGALGFLAGLEQSMRELEPRRGEILRACGHGSKVILIRMSTSRSDHSTVLAQRNLHSHDEETSVYAITSFPQPEARSRACHYAATVLAASGVAGTLSLGTDHYH